LYLIIGESAGVKAQNYFSENIFNTGYVLPIMGGLFSELWLFGFFICYWIGQKIKLFWLSVNQKKANISNQILYSILLAYSVSLCLGGVSDYLYLFLTYTIFLIPIKYIESLEKR
jgi:hypothetical protein